MSAAVMAPATPGAHDRHPSPARGGLATMVRLGLRRSRVFYVVWVLALVSMLPATLSKYETIVPAGSDPVAFLTALGNNPTMRALLGPAFDLMHGGGFTFWRVGTFTAAAAAMMAALGVIRATRAEEEDGRLELVRSGVVTRHQPLAAALLVSLGACAVTALGVAGAMAGMGSPLAGSVASGLGIGLTGAMFAGVGAVCAQVFESARTARSWAVGIVLGGLYLLRAMIDGSGSGAAIEPARWAMPLEWAALARPYAHERWWVLGLPALVTLLLCVAAFRLEDRRDLGAGLRAARPGRPGGAPGLRDARGLAWRLQRGGVWGWTIGVLVSAAGLGSMAVQIDSMLKQNPQVADMFRRMGANAASMQDAFYIAMLGIMVTIVSLASVLMLQRLRQEEVHGHAEAMLATATSRTSFALSHLLIAAVVGVVLTLATGVLLPVAQAAGDGSAHLPWVYLGAAAALLPGVVLVIGLAMAMIGWVPRLFGVVWAVIGWSILVSWVLPLFNLPAWLLRLHPWGHLPHLPTEPITWTAIVVESVLGVVLLTVGLVGYRRRDIQGR